MIHRTHAKRTSEWNVLGMSGLGRLLLVTTVWILEFVVVLVEFVIFYCAYVPGVCGAL